jgi:hypothetical protein
MGIITIEVPLEIREDYTVESEGKAKELITRVRGLATKKRKKKLRDLSDVVGIWTDRPESADQISRELREKSNSRGKRDDRGLDAALDAVIGMWSYRQESTEEIARKLRAGWTRSNGE